MRIHRFTGSKIEIIAEMINSTVRGWLNYFIKYNPSAVKYSIDF
ncbi:group II intron maturase-specific domain-containing protein [Peribacillus sp. NPDC097295]